MKFRLLPFLACLLGVLVSSACYAAADDPTAQQVASPGTEAALRRSISEVRAGNPDYAQMTPEFASVVRQQLTQMQSLFKTWGEVKSVEFKGVGPMGADIFNVTFENGAAEFRIGLNTEGKIAGEGVRPIGAQAGGAPEMVGLPEEGAPKALPGPYHVVTEPAFGAPGLRTYRPESLDSFSAHDKLPLVVWGNGGCALDSPVYAGFLSTIASHGFLVVTTSASSQDTGPGRQETADNLKAAIDWAERENKRVGAPTKGKIGSKVAVMGQSCGGGLSITLGADPRVATIGVFNFGIQPSSAGAPPPPAVFPTADSLQKLHGPVLLINGHDRDFMKAPSRATYEAIASLPVFYGARHGGGHLGTMGHQGGGEFANVASNWALWQLKGDKAAGAMFAGAKCGLCTDANWDVASRNLGK